MKEQERKQEKKTDEEPLSDFDQGKLDWLKQVKARRDREAIRDQRVFG